MACLSRYHMHMKWLLALTVSVMLLAGCDALGLSQPTPPPTPIPFTGEEAIGLVQTHLRKMCSSTSAYLKESHHFNAVRLKLVGQVAVQWQNSMEGQWFVLPEGGGIRTGTLVNEHCN